jgi:nitrate reductase beta subunit
MHRLLAIAKYDERYVIPPAHGELGDPRASAHDLEELACSVLDVDAGTSASGPFGGSSGSGAVPVTIESFNELRRRQTADEIEGVTGP